MLFSVASYLSAATISLFVFEDSSSNSSPRLYFKSEEDGEAYTNYIDHYYDEEI